MITTVSAEYERTAEIIEHITRKLAVDSQSIMLFTDYTDLLSDLLTLFGRPSSCLRTAGQVAPEVAQAADRARIELDEILSPSPFSGDVDVVLSKVAFRSDIIYIANPNRITGATYSLSDLEKMAESVPEGALIVDEHYFDYYGVTAQPLLKTHSNVIILRSFTAAFSIYSSDVGLVMSAPVTIDKIIRSCGRVNLSKPLCRSIESVLVNDEAVATRMSEVRTESLRISQALDDVGLFCRVTPTDFLLMRVADPTGFGNSLAADKIIVENLHGYPQMKNYVRYRIESPLNNDLLIRVIQRMNPDHFRMKKLDIRKNTVRRQTETVLPSSTRIRNRKPSSPSAKNRMKELAETN